MQRTFVFTTLDAVVYDKETKAVKTESVRFTYSENNDTEDKLIRKATKVTGKPIIAVENIKTVYELRKMSDDKFYELSELDSVKEC